MRSDWACWRLASRSSGADRTWQDGFLRSGAWLTTFFLVLLWFLWVAGFNGLLWIGIYALILPPAVRGVGRVAAQLVGAGTRESLGMTLVDV